MRLTDLRMWGEFQSSGEGVCCAQGEEEGNRFENAIMSEFGDKVGHKQKQIQTEDTMFSALHVYRWHPTWIKVPLMLLCRRHQHCQDGDHSDREHSQGCQSHESSNTPGYLSGVRLTTKGIPVAEKKEFRTTSPIKTFFKNPIKNTRQHHQTTNHFTSYTYIYIHMHTYSPTPRLQSSQTRLRHR